MRKVRKISNLFYLKEVMVCWLVFYMALILPSQIVMAEVVMTSNPAGTITVTPLGAGITQDMTATNGAIGNFSDFDIAAGHTVTCVQPDVTSKALFRVSGDRTDILGTFKANGGIWLINPAGILFGEKSAINVSQLVASSLNITDADFLNGAPYQFTGGQGELINGDVINEGSIDAERIALIGRNVINRGILMADKSVIMAAGNTVLLSENGGKVAVVVTVGDDWIQNENNYRVINEGKEGIQVNGDNSQIILAAGDIWSSAYIGAEGSGTIAVDMKAKGDIELQGEVEIDAYADSPAIATLNMTAGENITIGDDVGVEAYGYEDNATAIINANAGGSVYISGIERDAGLYAKAEGIAANTAQITVNAGDDVQVNGEYGYYDDSSDAYIYAGTYGGRTNNSSVDVTAGGDVRVEAFDDGFAGIEAESYAYPYPEQTVTSTVSTTINAGGKVVARADYESEVDIDSEAWNGTDNTATTSITAGEYVKAKANNHSDADIEAEAHGGTESNTATMNITVTGVEDSENYRNGGVYVIADYDSHAGILALADAEIDYPEYSYQVLAQSTSNRGTAIQTAQVFVNAARDVEVTSEGEYSDASLSAEAYNGLTNTAAVVVDAGGNVLVISNGDDNYAQSGIEAYADYATQTNTANVDITANNVLVIACEDGDAGINAYAGYVSSYGPSADDYDMEPDGTSSNASVKIETFKVEIEEPEPEPEPEPASLKTLYDMPFDCETILADYIDGGHVAVLAFNGGQAQIQAESMSYNPYAINNSDVLICAEGIVATGALSCQERSTYADINATSSYAYDNNASVGIGAGQGIGSMAYGYGAEASISSEAYMTSAGANNADLVACTGGPLAVLAIEGAYASIETNAYSSSINNASTGVCADSLIVVGAANNGTALISSNAGGYDYDDYDVRSASLEGEAALSAAETIVVSKGSGVAVIALDNGEAGIASSATNAFNNDAYTGVCAQDHIVVAAGISDYGDNYLIRSSENGSGGTAYISSEAGYPMQPSIAAASEEVIIQQEGPQTTANAETSVVSHQGSVIVADRTSDYGIGSAAISSRAIGAVTDTAYTGVAAGADLSTDSLDLVEPAEEPANIIEYLEQLYRYDIPLEYGLQSRGDVGVYATGPYSSARISSEAYGNYAHATFAQTVVCAPGEVSVESSDNDPCYPGNSIALIQSRASGSYMSNTASTQVYASEVYVDVDTYDGIGIVAEADGALCGFVTSEFSWVAGDEPVLWNDEQGSEEYGSTTLIIDSYANRQDCPDCPPCPDCPCQDNEELLAPVAPLAQFELPRIEGCPALTQAAALELGITGEALQVAIGNALALNPNIQPCQACSSLISAATILKDADGSRMADMAYVFNQIAPADAPFTPEMGAAIATAFSQNAQTDPRYASAMEYVDAFVQYVTVVSQDLRAPVADGDSVAFAMNKYGTALTEGNSNMAAYIMMQIQ